MNNKNENIPYSSFNKDLDNKVISDKIGNLKKNEFDIHDYEYLIPSKNTIADANDWDWSEAIKKAIDDANAAGAGVVKFRQVETKYKFTTSLNLKENVSLEGIGNDVTGTILSYAGTGFAIKTAGLHKKNVIKNIRLDVNGTGSGIKFGDIGANITSVPFDFEVHHVVVNNVATGKVGIEFNNSSHIILTGYICGFGSTTGGTALRFLADKHNSGVVAASGCTIGRVSSVTNVDTGVTTYTAANDIGLEINASGAGSVDTYSFAGCYFGGQTPIKLGSSAAHARSVSFKSCHAEFARLTGVASTVPIYAVDITKIIGGSWEDGTIAGFGLPLTTAFRYRDTVEEFQVRGMEINGVMTAVHDGTGMALLEGSKLNEGRLTNGSTASYFVNVPDKSVKQGARYIQHENMKTRILFDIATGLKEMWSKSDGTIDLTQSYSIGDEVKNTVPTRTRAIHSWKCFVAGTSSTVRFMATGCGDGTTAERTALTLTINERGYRFFDTDLVKHMYWNGTSWLG